MKAETSAEDLLRWRLERAGEEAPPAPRASRLLARSRPWWETQPGLLHSCLALLEAARVHYGRAMVDPEHSRVSHPVSVLLVQPEVEKALLGDIIYFSIRDRRLRLRLQLQLSGGVRLTYPELEITFLSETEPSPLFTAQGSLVADQEYRLDVELPGDLLPAWEQLRVTDRMPFRLIIRVV